MIFFLFGFLFLRSSFSFEAMSGLMSSDRGGFYERKHKFKISYSCFSRASELYDGFIFFAEFRFARLLGGSFSDKVSGKSKVLKLTENFFFSLAPREFPENFVAKYSSELILDQKTFNSEQRNSEISVEQQKTWDFLTEDKIFEFERALEQFVPMSFKVKISRQDHKPKKERITRLLEAMKRFETSAVLETVNSLSVSCRQEHDEESAALDISRLYDEHKLAERIFQTFESMQFVCTKDSSGKKLRKGFYYVLSISKIVMQESSRTPSAPPLPSYDGDSDKENFAIGKEGERGGGNLLRQNAERGYSAKNNYSLLYDFSVHKRNGETVFHRNKNSYFLGSTFVFNINPFIAESSITSHASLTFSGKDDDDDETFDILLKLSYDGGKLFVVHSYESETENEEREHARHYHHRHDKEHLKRQPELILCETTGRL